MPEYLAPGVYVEETSFRAKSIEGVGTSTTAFAGPTRKGPVATTQKDAAGNLPAPPEMLTSYGDFVRVYGGLQPLGFAPARPNYLANAVLNFFNEGGGRLYVARTVAADAKPAQRVLAGADGSADRVIWRARFQGAAGNARVTVREILSPATGRVLSDPVRTPVGSLVGSLVVAPGATAATPARITADAAAGPRFAVGNGAVLRLDASGTTVNVRFLGQPAELKAGTALVGPVEVNAANRTLHVTLWGVEQVITLPERADYTPAEIALEINSRLVGGYARLTTDAAADAPAGRLVLGTDRRGSAARVAVTEAVFGFTAGQSSPAQDPATNTVPDLEAVTAADLETLLGVGTRRVHAELTADNRLALTTTATGRLATLAVVEATGAGVVSAHAAFGLVPTSPDPAALPRGRDGSTRAIYAKRSDDGRWFNGSDEHVVTVDDTVQGNLLHLMVLVDEPAGSGPTFEPSGESMVFDDLGFASGDARFVGTILARNPPSRAEALQNLVWLDLGATAAAGPIALHAALFGSGKAGGDDATGRTAEYVLEQGTDGGVPTLGAPTDTGSYAAAFEQLRGLEDVSIVAAPGHAAFAETPDEAANYQSIRGALLQHVALPRAYRIAVLDAPANLLPGQVRELRAPIDSTRAALYHPWVTVANPLARPGRSDIPKEINLPPSGFLCGIYARNDAEQSVAKAPANEVVRGALRFESDINFAQNQLLNPLGINCLRYFPGRGYRVWGARTVSSDPEWKYVNVRRFFNYLEASIDRGTQWAVFENNGDRLWANIRETIEAFLYNEWASGNLLGESPKEAFFVRCDRSTMTQNDLDNGRLICLIGVAALKPAEFVIFRIGQKTADARS